MDYSITDVDEINVWIGRVAERQTVDIKLRVIWPTYLLKTFSKNAKVYDRTMVNNRTELILRKFSAVYEVKMYLWTAFQYRIWHCQYSTKVAKTRHRSQGFGSLIFKLWTYSNYETLVFYQYDGNIARFLLKCRHYDKQNSTFSSNW